MMTYNKLPKAVYAYVDKFVYHRVQERTCGSIVYPRGPVTVWLGVGYRSNVDRYFHFELGWIVAALSSLDPTAGASGYRWI